MAKTLNARIMSKHDKEENWKKATSFQPKIGEIIIYEADNLSLTSSVPRIKIGDGLTTVSSLPFITEPYVIKEQGKGLSTNDFTDIYKARVDIIPDNAVWRDIVYKEGFGIGLNYDTFYNKGVVEINQRSDGVTIEVVTRTGPKNTDVNIKPITISNLVSDEAKEEIVSSLAVKLPEYITTGEQAGAISVNGISVKINGWDQLGELAFYNKATFIEELQFSSDAEVYISTKPTDAPPYTAKLWYDKTSQILYAKGVDEVQFSPVASNLEFVSLGEEGKSASFQVKQKNGVDTIYTNGLALSGGTVTGITTFSNTTDASSCTTGSVIISGGLGVSKNIYGDKVYGSVWNDYAEYRVPGEENIEPGRVVYSGDDGKLHLTTGKLQFFEGVVSDTFGFAIGETSEATIPLAVAGRVLVYTDEELHAGNVVCAGPNGKVCKMTREEIAKYPDRIVGIVSEIPTYDTWGEKNIAVNNRVWIRIR